MGRTELPSMPPNPTTVDRGGHYPCVKKPLAIENVHYLSSSFHISKPLVFHRRDEYVPYLHEVKDVVQTRKSDACDQCRLD